ncbi:chaplin [Streptomyces viridosporus]|uniref:chaplin n=1 Tax=Streptomyces viridosporus TaxID=67581 RepID=UPI001CC58737|nr:chaplin [Streptomyces viridosporus]
MRQTLSRGVFAAAAATGILSLYGTPALADSYAVGGVEDSPGVLSGNNVQAPVHVPVNACGNTVGAVSAFNTAADSFCANDSQTQESGARSSDSSRSASPRGASSYGDSSYGDSSYGDSGGGAQAVGGTEGSPGVLSGNNVQAPVHVPVNACGNDVTAVGAFNTAADSSCANDSQARESGARSSASSRGDSSYGNSGGGARAVSDTEGSPGVLSGNNVQVPVHVPLNVCGNTLDLIGLFDSSYGTSCANTTQPGYGTEDVTPPRTVTPTPEPGKRTPPAPPSVDEERPGPGPQLAETGAEGLIVASAASAALITGGAMLYRRRRAGGHR